MKNFTRSLSLLALCISTISMSKSVLSARIKPGLFTSGGVIGCDNNCYGPWPAPVLYINGKNAHDLALLKTLVNSNGKDTLKILKTLVHLDAQGKLFKGKKTIVPDKISNLPTYKKYNNRLRRWFQNMHIWEQLVLFEKINCLATKGRIPYLNLYEFQLKYLSFDR